MKDLNDNVKTLIILGVIAVVVSIVLFFAYYKYDYNIYFLNTNESDAIIIQSNKANIVVDTGEDVDKQTLINKLNKLNITKIDYLIISHPDKDHIGNASYLVENYEITNVIEPNFDKKTVLQKTFRDDIQRKGNINHMILTKDYEFEIDNMKFEIAVPNGTEYNEDNDYSLVTYVTIEDKVIMLPGDIEIERIEETLAREKVNVDIMKLPHHGRYNDLSTELIEYVEPNYVVSTGETDKRIVDFINSRKVELYNTVDHEIIFSIKKNKIKVIDY